MFKLYHIEESIESNAQEIRTKNKDLARLREEQRVHDEALDSARANQAKARTGVMQMEKKIKKAEKALDAKVDLRNCYVRKPSNDFVCRDLILSLLKRKSLTLPEK